MTKKNQDLAATGASAGADDVVGTELLDPADAVDAVGPVRIDSVRRIGLRAAALVGVMTAGATILSCTPFTHTISQG